MLLKIWQFFSHFGLSTFFSKRLCSEFNLEHLFTHWLIQQSLICSWIQLNVASRNYFVSSLHSKLSSKVEKAAICPTLKSLFDIQNQKQVQFCFKHNAPMYKELIWLVKYRNLWKMHFRGFGTKISKNGHSEWGVYNFEESKAEL